MMETQDNTYKRIKLMSLGDSKAGKSCLIKRFCESNFSEEYVSTIGIDFGVKSYTLGDEECIRNGLLIIVKVNFWDTAGQDEYFDIRNEFYKDTNGVFIVFDISDRQSFNSLRRWINEFKEYSSFPVYTLIIGNKSDKPRKVSKEEATETAESIGAK